MFVHVPERFETERLILRKPVMKDAPIIFEKYCSDPEFPKFMTWVAHREVSETEAFLTSVISAFEKQRNVSYVISEANDEGNPIGMIGHSLLAGFICNYGYTLAEEYWNRGYTSEALSALTDWAFEQPYVYRAQALCHPENKASARVMQKVGLEFEGVMKRYIVLPNISSEPVDALMYAKVK